jgi:F-type H+-transporting ATPase subunit delta
MKKADEIVKGFLSYLSSQGELDLLPEIIEELKKISKERRNVAQVISALPLSDEEEEEILKFLQTQFGSDLKLATLIDPQILGGLVIKVGDQVIDKSLAGKLKEIKERLEG